MMGRNRKAAKDQMDWKSIHVYGFDDTFLQVSHAVAGQNKTEGKTWFNFLVSSIGYLLRLKDKDFCLTGFWHSLENWASVDFDFSVF